MTASRRWDCWRWLARFSLINAALLVVIGSRYLLFYGIPDAWLANLYLLLATLGHYALLAGLPLLLLAAPIILLWPRRWLLSLVAVVTASLIAALLLLDSLVYSENRFHITTLTAQILAAKTWIFAAVYFVIAVIIQAQIAAWLWRRIDAGGRPSKWPRRAWLALAACFISAQLIHIWADANYYTPVTSLSQYLPGYRGITAKSFLVKRGWVDLQQARERELADRLSRPAQTRGLNYPLQPLQCRSPETPLNLLVIMVDAWRWDQMDPKTTPEISRFAHRAQVFQQHYSGGNSSRMGAFSFFYGLHSTYFKTVESLQQPAVLIEELQKADYQFGIFSSAPLYRPVTLDRTAFANVQGLQLAMEPESDPPYVRDRKVTESWQQWLQQRDASRPFFGFLFYDAPTAGDFPPDYPLRFQASADSDDARQFADYRTSIHFSDQQIGQALAGLEAEGLLDRTVVIITSDHGQEFNETGQGFYHHGSAYSEYQLHVPLVLHWPGRSAEIIDRRSSHYDIAPTLLTELLNCSNPVADYALGNNLFAGKSWSWLLAGSYYNYAIYTPEQVIITFPNGLYEVRDSQYRVIDSPRLDGAVLTEVMQSNGRFHQ